MFGGNAGTSSGMNTFRSRMALNVAGVKSNAIGVKPCRLQISKTASRSRAGGRCRRKFRQPHRRLVIGPEVPVELCLIAREAVVGHNLDEVVEVAGTRILVDTEHSIVAARELPGWRETWDPNHPLCLNQFGDRAAHRFLDIETDSATGQVGVLWGVGVNRDHRDYRDLGDVEGVIVEHQLDAGARRLVDPVLELAIAEG